MVAVGRLQMRLGNRRCLIALGHREAIRYVQREVVQRSHDQSERKCLKRRVTVGHVETKVTDEGLAAVVMVADLPVVQILLSERRAAWDSVEADVTIERTRDRIDDVHRACIRIGEF